MNLFLSVSLLSSIVIFLSLSRTGILMIAIIIILNSLLSLEKLNFETIFIKNRKKTIFILSLIIILGIIFLIKGFLGDNTLMVTLLARVIIWEDVLPIMKENFLIGIGFRSIIDTLGAIKGHLSTHNDFIDIFIKGGIIGFILIYAYYFKRIWILIKNNYHEFASLIVAIFIAGFFQNPLKNLSVMIVFTLLLSYSYEEVHR